MKQLTIKFNIARTYVLIQVQCTISLVHYILFHFNILSYNTHNHLLPMLHIT